MWLWLVTVVIAALALYAIWGREWLKRQPWAQGFFAWIEPFEITLFKKSGTLLLARLKMATGGLLTLLTQLGTIDITPLMPLIDDKWEGLVKLAFNMLPLLITLVGWVDQNQRYTNTKPVELVALPDAVAANMPDVVEAETAKVKAVAAVKQNGVV